MIKIGNSKYDTYPVGNCNLRNLLPYIYLTPVVFDRCPICAQKLKKDYVYAIQISKTECVKLHGSVCYSCSSFFSTHRFLLDKLEDVKIYKNAYELRKDYFSHFNREKELSKFKNTKSAFKQYTVVCKGLVKAYTIVYNSEDIDEENKVIHYTDKIAVTLLRSEKTGESYVEIQGRKYVIVDIKQRNSYDDEVKAEIENVVSSKMYFERELPELTTQKTVYVYRGNIACHKKHYVEEFKAQIKLFDNKNMHFYVEYCYDCNKFFIKYDDYKEYLKRYKFFPAKLKYVRNKCDDYDRAEKSPLFLNGYTVNSSSNLSNEERQCILSFVMRYGILSKRKVLDYLEIFINTNGQNLSMEEAVAKWKKDKDFVLNYKLDECPLVYINVIERRK